jgi:predicted nucleic acid-binding protein
LVPGAVADAWAVLAFLRGEGEAERKMRRYLRRAAAGNLRLKMSLINLGEVYYRLIQLVGPDAASEKVGRFRRAPVEFLAVREPLVMDAAEIKAAWPLSYADAFAVATARSEGVPVVTGDPEICALPRSVVAVRRLVR